MIENFLDATNLNKSASSKDIIKSIKEAVELNCYAFCTYISNSFLVNKVIKTYNSNIKKVYVIGFPFGTLESILNDLEFVDKTDADEYDLVIPVQFFKEEQFLRAHKIGRGVRKKVGNKILKLIIETSLLTEIRLPEAVKFGEDMGADIIKTNTGIYKFRRRSIQEDIQLIQEYTSLPIKASGGIGDYKLAKELVDLGVCRVGTSKFKEIIEGENIDAKNG
jgi:deoxyribose-phosphate aldolase